MRQSIYKLLYASYFSHYEKWKKHGNKIEELRFRVTLAAMRRFLVGSFCEYLAKLPFQKAGVSSDRKERIIASLTSFPARIDKVWIAISTILLQTVKPDTVELWLAKEQFPGGIDSLPQNLLRLRDYGLVICFCDDDLRSHKKYYYAMQRHPDDIVITFDDDIYYPLDSIEQVWKLHQQSPEDVVGMSTPVFSSKDLMNPLEWGMQSNSVIGRNNLGIYGGSCSLFPPRALHSNVYDKEAIKKLAPLADDLWLTAMTYMNGRKVTSVGRLPFPESVQDTQEQALTTTNNSSSSGINNNSQWSAILDHYRNELSEWVASVE